MSSTRQAEVRIEPQNLFQLLNSRRRRLAIVELARIRAPISAANLAHNIATNHPMTDGSTSAYRRVHIGLIQTHLDVLEEAELVSVTADNIVTPHEDVEVVADIVASVESFCVTGGRQ